MSKKCEKCSECGSEMEEKNPSHHSAMGEPWSPCGTEYICANPRCSRFGR